MVLVLHRHKQRVQHIHCHSFSSRCSHESRATRTIMILVSSFFTFYSVYTLMTVWTTLVANPGRWTVNTYVLVSSCFPALSPLVLIISDTRVSQICFVCSMKKNGFA
jgi:vomeronasal1 receptor